MFICTSESKTLHTVNVYNVITDELQSIPLLESISSCSEKNAFFRAFLGKASK